MTSTDLVNTTTGEVVAHRAPGISFDLEGSMPLGPQDIQMPQLRLVQGTSRNVEDGHAGEYLFSVDGSYHKEFAAVIIGLTNKSRAYFAKGKFDQPPLCASDDNIVPRDAAEARAVGAGLTCAGCAYSKFGEDNSPPPCTEAWNYLGLTDTDDPLPFLFRVTGNGIRQAKAYNTPFAVRGKPFFTRRTFLSSKKEQNQSGSFYVPQFRTEDLVNADEAQVFRTLASEYVGFRAKADDAGYEPAAAAQPSGPPLAHHQELTPDEIMGMRDATPAPDTGAPELFPDDSPEYAQFRTKLDAPPTPRRGPQRAGAH